MQSKISLLLPSRGRPSEFKRMWESALKTAACKDCIQFVVYRDTDDTAQYEYPPNVEVITSERIVLSRMWNACFEKATGDILMHCGDDIVFRTPGWDEMVKKAFEVVDDKILFVHGEDGHWHSMFGTHGFIHRKWVETVGYFVPPFYVSDFNDTHLNEVANALGRRLFLPFVTEHMHFLFGKGAKDQTHIDRLNRHELEKPEALYESEQMKRSRQADAQKLFNAIFNGQKK